MAVKQAVVRFYVDADTLGLAKILSNLRSDVTYPGDPGGIVHKRQRPPCLISQTDTADTEWIADVASRGWLIITRDHRIARRTRERAVVEAAGAKLVAIGNRENLNNWGILEVVMSQWHWIERQTDQPGPFIYSITRTTRRQL